MLGVDAATLPIDRVEAAAALDAAGAGNWRILLDRFAEERAPVYLRPAADASAALRRLGAAGTAVGVFTDAPEELARVALAQLGATRRVAAWEAGPDALTRLRSRLGADAPVVPHEGRADPIRPLRLCPWNETIFPTVSSTRYSSGSIGSSSISSRSTVVWRRPKGSGR